MKQKGIYFAEADLIQAIYLKEEPVLSAVGHFHDGLELVAVLQGEIEAFHMGSGERIKKGELFFVDSFECHHYTKITDSIKAIVIVLSNDYTNVFREMYGEKTLPRCMRDVEKNVAIVELLTQWLAEPKKDFMLNSGYANLLFFRLIEAYSVQEQTGAKDKTAVVKLLKYIGEHYLEDISLTSVAKAMGYSKEYCSTLFSGVVGMKFRDYLNFLRLKKAQEYFSTKKIMNLTTIEIIYKCGFKSTATFYRAQKRFESKILKSEEHFP